MILIFHKENWYSKKNTGIAECQIRGISGWIPERRDMTTRLYKGITLRNFESYRAIANDGMTLEEAEAIFKEYYESIDFTEEFFVQE